MKKANKILAVILAVILALSFSAAVFAQSEISNTQALLEGISKTGKLKVSVTGFRHQLISENIAFDFYDDFRSDNILCDFAQKGIQLNYNKSSLKLILPKFRCYFGISITDPQYALILNGVGLFQKLFKSFVDDPQLKAFNLTTNVQEKGGQIYTTEFFEGKLIGTSGTFVYNSNGELTEITLSDNAGESIAFSVSNITNDFDSKVFNVPFYYFNISLFFKILTIILPMLGITLPVAL